VFVNGPVFTAAPERPYVRAVAVTGGVISAVGFDRDVGDWIGPRTEVVDLRGRSLLPGFQDAHVHPVHGGLRRMRCDLEPAGGAVEALSTVAAHAEQAGEGWILGGGWHYEWFGGGSPSALELDRVTGARPAYLVVTDGHSAWANSRALELAGVAASTPDPPDGRIERLAGGRPQGTLHEGAMELVERVLPPDDPELTVQALLAGQEHLLSCGITAWQDAWVDAEIHEAYRAVAADGRLVGRAAGALFWERDESMVQLERLERMRGEGFGRYRPGTVKLMLDGVCENFTAAMKEPYLTSSGDPGRGMLFIDPDELPTIVVDLDRRGFQCHFHAIGDEAVSFALSAAEQARLDNGWTDGRHHIAHIQVVDPPDVARFARWGVVANAQPLWACNEPAMTELTIPVLGDPRSRHQYPFGSLLRSGATLAMGSDWPVSSADVLAQLAVAVTRLPPDGAAAEVFLPDERLPLVAALTAFTAGSAYVNHLDHVSGTIAGGKAADLVVLSGDVLESGAIGGTRVDMTMAAGAVVYER
jgi:hypothetical protein